MGLRLVAICRADIETTLMNDAGLQAKFGFVAVRHMDIAAVLVPVIKHGFFASKRKVLTSEISQLQTAMEAVQSFGPTLGAQHGCDFEDALGVLAYLAGNYAKLQRLLVSAGHYRQFQIDIRWNPAEALVQFGDLEVVQKALTTAGKDSQAKGLAIHEAMETVRARLTDAAETEVRIVSQQVLRMPVGEPEAVGSLVVAIKPVLEPDLDKAVEAIDRLAPDLFKISYRGPLPAISFACVGMKRPEKGELDEAQNLLGLGSYYAVAEVENAFKAFIKKNHPDVGGDAEQAEKGRASRDLLINVALYRVQAQTDEPQPLLVEITGEGLWDNLEAAA